MQTERGGGIGLGGALGLKLDLQLVEIDGLQLINGAQLCGSVRLTTDGVEVSDGATPCGTTLCGAPAFCVPQAQLASPTDGKWFETIAQNSAGVKGIGWAEFTGHKGNSEHMPE